MIKALGPPSSDWEVEGSNPTHDTSRTGFHIQGKVSMVFLLKNVSYLFTQQDYLVAYFQLCVKRLKLNISESCPYQSSLTGGGMIVHNNLLIQINL